MYDVIIVGARCAGSSSAMLLARRGHRVLLVDKATFPSDTMSTHILWPQGSRALQRWGLFDTLAATGCPPTARSLTLDFADFAIKGKVTGPDDSLNGFGPRRYILDKILVDAAVESGAELREAFTLDDLLWDGDRVVGIRGHGRGQDIIEERARIVVGADGVHSLVARLVEALEYDAIPPLASYYYSYFSGFGAEDIEWYPREGQATTIIPTHDGLTLVACSWPSARFKEVREDIDGSVAAQIASLPRVSDRMQGAKQEEKWVGTAGVPNYYRRPYGAGWALVGDAGYDRDPVTGQGISDAFLDAESLAEAIHEASAGSQPLDDLFADHESRRNKRTRGMYKFTCTLAALAPLPPPMEQIMRATARDDAASNLYCSVVTGSVPLSHFMNSANIASVLAKAP